MHMFNPKVVARVVGVFVALALATTLTAGAPASASAAPQISAKKDFITSASSAVTVPDLFAAQGRAVGLTAAKQKGLQGKIDAYLAELGPKAIQTDFDTITLPGSVLHVTVPGEARPPGLSAAAPACPYYFFCAYRDQYFQGDDWRFEDSCGLRTYIPWTGHGSWINNQTPGTQATISFWDGQPDWKVPGAYSQQASGVGWYPVDYFNPC
jgi:hypothetical protein